MNYHEMNTMIKKLVGQLQNIMPQVELARGKEACVMQETQDAAIVEKEIDETFKVYNNNIGMSRKSAFQLFDVCRHPLIEEIIHKLNELDYSPSPAAWINNETKKASLQEGYVEEYINHNKDALIAINRLSKELSNVSPPFLVSQQLRNVIGKIGALGSRFAAHEYSKKEGFPGPFDMIRNKIGGLLDVIKSAQEVCIHLSDDTTTVLVKIYHRVSDTKDLVNRNLSKGETPVQRLESIQDDLSQAFKKIEMDYRDLLEESAVKFEIDHIKLAGIAETVPANGGAVKTKQKKTRKKTPPQLLKETRERQAVKELAKNDKITAEELGKILGCNKSTVVRLRAWKNKGVLANPPPPNGFKKQDNESKTDVEAVSENEPDEDIGNS